MYRQSESSIMYTLNTGLLPSTPRALHVYVIRTSSSYDVVGGRRLDNVYMQISYLCINYIVVITEWHVC